jgi:hypothetical protein
MTARERDEIFTVNGHRGHDLRDEYASLAERGVPLSQIRDLLGHHSIVTTERYDTQTADALMASAKLLENGGTFTIPSQSGEETAESGHDSPLESGSNDVKGKT